MSAFPLHLLLRPRRLVAILFLFVFIELCLLPSDHRFRLYYRHKYYSLVEPHLPAHQLISEKSPFAVDLEHDVGLILKTGFGTKQRPVAHLQAIADGANFSDIIVIGDYSSEQGGSFSYHGAPLPVYDAVAMNIEAATRGLTLEGPTILAEPSDRLLDYQKIHAAIDAQDADLADKLSREFGWKLDAFKFIPGLELARRLMPSKKWYILVDDDTYLVHSTLKPFLGQFNPQKKYFFGNAVGGWEGRFAHGGSGIILSRRALLSLFTKEGRMDPEFWSISLTERLGDVAIAKVLGKAGVPLDESYCHLFNGEPPLVTKIRNDRFCTPLMTFHRMKTSEDVADLQGRLGSITQPISWSDLWRIYGAPPFDTYETPRPEWDHIGGGDEHTQRLEQVDSWEACSRACQQRGDSCVAWTWLKAESICHTSPWMIIGEKRADSVSALNVPVVKRLASNCRVSW